MSATNQSNVQQNNFSKFPRHARQQIRANAKQSQKIRENASLPKDAWVEIDDMVYKTMDEELRIVNDLRSAGLTTSADVNSKVLTWHKADDDHEATVAMSPETATDEGAQELEPSGVPLPIYHDDFSIGFRDTGSNMRGIDIESLNVSSAARAVAELMEDTVLNGWDATIDSKGHTLHGLTGHPDINTGTLSDWTGQSDTEPKEIRADIRAMANAIKDDGFMPGRTGYWLYLARNLYDHLDDFSSHGDGSITIGEHVRTLNSIARIAPLDYLESGTALMFRPTNNVIDLAFAADERTVQWGGPFRENFKVLSIMAPRVKSTMEGDCGIAYYGSA